jgi:ribosome-associated toxin RatA of RatAB toxin-antitoxin module
MQIKRSHIVSHSAFKMYSLVQDIENYPSFLVNCISGDVLEISENEMFARLCFSKAGLKYTLMTHNTFLPGQRIDLELHEGPFNYFFGHWIFLPLNRNSCRISIELNFSISGNFPDRFAEFFFLIILQK